MALGEKKGCNRMWSETVGGVTVVLDLSGRPYFSMNAGMTDGDVDSGTIAEGDVLGGFSVEMFHHFLDSLLTVSQSTCHVLISPSAPSGSNYERAVNVVTALGRCLKRCIEVDGRRGGMTASSKGTLSA